MSYCRTWLVLLVLLASACAAPLQPDEIAFECFDNRPSANAFSRYAIGRFREFTEATGVGRTSKPTLAVWTDRESRCGTGAMAVLADTRLVLDSDTRERLADQFHRFAIAFRSSHE